MKLCHAALTLMIVAFCVRSAEAMTCVGWQESVWNAETATLEVTYHEFCMPGGGDPPPPSDDPYPGGGPAYGWDGDADGIIDDWSLVVETTDPCGQNFDWGDRLGSDYSGPNGADAPAGETGRPGHNGVDIQANSGDAVNAIRNGTVTRVGDDGSGCGYSVRLTHADGSSSTYCHMEFGSAEHLDVDIMVAAGQRIGSAGGTGSADGAVHLHLIFYDPNGNHDEFFNHVNTPPQPGQLDPTGC